MNRFQRRRLKHQQNLEAGVGIFRTLEKQGNQIVEVADQEPVARGFPKDSQTAKVMKALELYGAENARL